MCHFGRNTLHCEFALCIRLTQPPSSPRTTASQKKRLLVATYSYTATVDTPIPAAHLTTIRICLRPRTTCKLSNATITASSPPACLACLARLWARAIGGCPLSDYPKSSSWSCKSDDSVVRPKRHSMSNHPRLRPRANNNHNNQPRSRHFLPKLPALPHSPRGGLARLLSNRAPRARCSTLLRSKNLRRTVKTATMSQIL